MNRVLRMIALGGITVSALRGEAAAQDSLPAFSIPFGVGERLEYNARFGPISVGEGAMEVLEIQDVRGLDAWHTRFQLKGGLAFYKADFLLESWFDVNRIYSLRFVNDSEQGGKVRERAKLGVRFSSIVLADGTQIPISTETIYREGDAPGRESAAKIGGGAIGGAIIGGILGGAKGVAIGSAIGGGAGSAAVMAGGRNPATLSPGSPVTIRLEQPATVTVEK